MSDQLMNTKEIAEYLGIHEKQVYALIKAKRIPCTRVTGKWLFPKHLIDNWINDQSRFGVEGGITETEGRRDMLLSAGSNDPILDILLSSMKGKHEEFLIFHCNTGSLNGLDLLAKNNVDIVWCHLYDQESGTYNIPYIKSYFPEKKIAVVHLFYREQGFLLAPDLAGKVQSFEDLTDRQVKFINRQKGSGTRHFLDYNLNKRSIDQHKINGYDNEVYTHTEVGLTIFSGKANAGVATIAAAKMFGLSFVPLVKESYDMVVSQETFFNQGVQAFIDTLNSDDFRGRVKPLGDYDFSNSGKILYSSSS
ncbi:MAG: hypothetical protein CVV44_04400 [Spirochaetae bacterium HGW-Spirochaetae-1]|nr:MAG: hypothetical protein CVV44_04400 [Spirochaetae bacterium HGW-Spirochaetae-1]